MNVKVESNTGEFILVRRTPIPGRHFHQTTSSTKPYLVQYAALWASLRNPPVLSAQYGAEWSIAGEARYAAPSGSNHYHGLEKESQEFGNS